MHMCFFFLCSSFLDFKTKNKSKFYRSSQFKWVDFKFHNIYLKIQFAKKFATKWTLEYKEMFFWDQNWSHIQKFK